MTPGWRRTASIWALVPTAPTTPILSNEMDCLIAVALMARLASASVVPCTSTVVVPVRPGSCWARKARHR